MSTITTYELQRIVKRASEIKEQESLFTCKVDSDTRVKLAAPENSSLLDAVESAFYMAYDTVKNACDTLYGENNVSGEAIGVVLGNITFENVFRTFTPGENDSYHEFDAPMEWSNGTIHVTKVGQWSRRTKTGYKMVAVRIEVSHFGADADTYDVHVDRHGKLSYRTYGAGAFFNQVLKQGYKHMGNCESQVIFDDTGYVYRVTYALQAVAIGEAVMRNR